MSIPRGHDSRPDDARLLTAIVHAVAYCGALTLLCVNPVFAVQNPPAAEAAEEEPEDWLTPADAYRFARGERLNPVTPLHFP